MGTYLLFIIIDQVMLSVRQTVVWKYIFCNPDKLDGKLLVSSFGCAAETADIEFGWTRRHAIDKGTHLGRHLIQAFEPGEVSSEEAHEIGMQLAKEILGGKYEFVLTTHIDKGHIHNHLIFNAVSFTDHKHYHSNKRSYHEIRRASDRLCREHGLSVIVPGRDKGKSYIEHQAAQNGTSYKAKLKAAIDRLIPVSSSLDELLVRLQREGYEIKRGKYISIRVPDQERFTRFKTLGTDYTKEVRHHCHRLNPHQGIPAGYGTADHRPRPPGKAN